MNIENLLSERYANDLIAFRAREPRGMLHSVHVQHTRCHTGRHKTAELHALKTIINNKH